MFEKEELFAPPFFSFNVNNFSLLKLGAMSDHPEISEVQVHCLLEKLRQKSIYYPTVQDALKSVRSAINERKVATDISEKSQYQVCLDSLQTKIKVTSLQSMVERLEAISRQLG